jgi:hypothetical protein
MMGTRKMGLRAGNWAYPAVLENIALAVVYGLLERLLAEGVGADAQLRVAGWMLAPLALLLALEAPALRQMIGGECLRGRIPPGRPDAEPVYGKLKPDGMAQQAAFVAIVVSAFMRVIFRMVLIVTPVLEVLRRLWPAPWGGWDGLQVGIFIYLLVVEFRLWYYLTMPPQRGIGRGWYWPSRVVALAMLALHMYAFEHGVVGGLRPVVDGRVDWFLTLFLFFFLFIPLRWVEFSLAWKAYPEWGQRLALAASTAGLMWGMLG